MKTLVLSDNTGTNVRALEDERARVNQALLDEYALRQAEWDAARTRATGTITAAWRDRRVWAFLVAVIRNFSIRRIPPPAEPVLQTERSRQEIVWAAGREGENQVAEILNNRLDDTWTLVRGFSGRGGEIDVVAVGPAGVAALEIKATNGVVSCDGDQWWRDKYDRYGNLCESGLPIADRKGRSPSQQINGSAAALAAAIHLPVARVVILAHERSDYGNFSNPTVSVIVRTEDLDLDRACAIGSRPLSEVERRRAVETMKQASSSWQQRRQRGSRQPRRARQKQPSRI